MATRVTQTVKVVPADIQSATGGGLARVTQVVKVVVCTVQLTNAGGLAMKGMGS